LILSKAGQYVSTKTSSVSSSVTMPRSMLEDEITFLYKSVPTFENYFYLSYRESVNISSVR